MRLFQRGRAVVAPFAEQSGHQLWIGYLKNFDADIAALGGQPAETPPARRGLLSRLFGR